MKYNRDVVNGFICQKIGFFRIFQIVDHCPTNEETDWTVKSLLTSALVRKVDRSLVRKSSKGQVPIGPPSGVIAILLRF